MKKCKVCGELTNTVFNINLKATPICEECARRIFLQQATWYSQQEFKNLALPQVSKCDSIERKVSVCDCKHSHYHIEEMAVVVCTDCGELLGKQTDC